jgi:hypothetical protein
LQELSKQTNGDRITRKEIFELAGRHAATMVRITSDDVEKFMSRETFKSLALFTPGQLKKVLSAKTLRVC